MIGISCIISTLAIFPSYLILKKYIDPIYAILGAIAVTTLIAINFFSFSLMLENLFIPLLLFTLLAIIEAFDTNALHWQIMAGVSVASLEITRTLGQIIELSFIVTFLLYLLFNRKLGIVKIFKEKMAMLIAFFIIFAFWHVFLYMASNASIEIAGTNSGGNMGENAGNVGASYNTFGMLSGISFAFDNLTDLIVSIKIFLNHINYLVLASFFVPLFTVYYLLIRADKNIETGQGYKYGLLYIYLSVLVTLLSVTIIVMGMMGSMAEIHFGLGRYLDPFLAPVIILGLVNIFNVNSIDLKKRLFNHVFFVEAVVLFILFISFYDLNIFFDPADFVNNPSMTYLFKLVDPYLLLIVIVAISVISTSLLLLSSIEKRAIAVFLLFIITSSILASYITYGAIVSESNFRARNDISLYLENNSNDKTLLIIDKNMTLNDLNLAGSVYGFWNIGDENKLDINDSHVLKLFINNVYIITKNNLTYTRVAADNGFILYKNQSIS